ncbi:37S ribosomal protein S22 [Arachnomyces sp. PD_36]|nr:37S ribosomal protein S22 [Arachnomyces sp. PD_36]
MLSRPPTARVCRSCSQDLFQILSQDSRRLTHSHQATKILTAAQCQSRPLSKRRFSSVAAPSATIHKPSRRNPRKSHNQRRQVSDNAPENGQPSRKDSKKELAFSLADRIGQNQDDIASLLDDLDLSENFPDFVDGKNAELVEPLTKVLGYRNEQDLEARVRMARQHFGETLPEGELNKEETRLYTRLYGEPIYAEEELDVEVEEDDSETTLFRETPHGELEEVAAVSQDLEEVDIEEESLGAEKYGNPDTVDPRDFEQIKAIAEQLGGELMHDENLPEAEPSEGPRTHPLTQAARFATSPTTVYLPYDTVIGPIDAILSCYSNKHISEGAHKAFGGKNLPFSTSVPPPRENKPQLPIQLEAGQQNMSEMEANAYLAVLYPGIFASAMSVLTEIRKRLGPEWVRGLMGKEGGPSVLDAGGGGAGVLAWREILRAEWSMMSPDHPEEVPIPMGKSTVLTGSAALRHRASALLNDTTFLPRLPDYVHVRDSPTFEDSRPAPKRKQYDVIFAPHTLLSLKEDYERKEHVQNLWSLLNPNGGVLILLERGLPRGFEVVAGAREMILERLISSPGSTNYEDLLQSPSDKRFVNKDTGMILAPCTNHAKCPMYLVPGQVKGRKDFCYFKQRYIRPQFLQRILGGSSHNHEDVQFSYLAVQKGVDQRESHGLVQGEKATDAAFAGYGKDSTEAENSTTASSQQDVNTLSLPRTIFPPIKRRGHVMLEVCTPSAKIERWVVTRSLNRQAYHDARKSSWGDLWALGAKTRIPRNPRIGQKEEKTRGKQQRSNGDEDDAGDLEAELGQEGELDIPDFSRTMDKFDGKVNLTTVANKKGKGTGIPSWLKKVERKRLRRETKGNGRKESQK